MTARTDRWVTTPLNAFGGMPLHWRTSGVHYAPGQTQRVIGDHVYIAQPMRDGSLVLWRLDLAAGEHGYRWTRVHRLAPAGGAA